MCLLVLFEHVWTAVRYWFYHVLFIYFLQWFAICSYLFGNYISSFRTLFFSKSWIMFACFNVIDKQTPFFQSESYPEWSSHFLQEIQTVLHDFACVKKSIMSICMGLTPRKQGPWVLKFSRPTCNGRRWSKAELKGSGSWSLCGACETVHRYLNYFARVLYIYICRIYKYICCLYMCMWQQTSLSTCF